MTDIVLLQPKCGVWDIMGVRAPTGLLSIASIPYNRGYNVVLIDQRVDLDWENKVKQHIKKGARIVCFTTMVGEQIKFMMEASKFVKSVNQDILTVLGGPWAMLEPEICMQDECLDLVCYGEGDYLLSDLMDYCEGRRKIEDILGILYRTKDGAIKKNAPRPMVENLDDLPKVPYHLINIKNYSAVGFRPGRSSLSIVTSRGCPFRCSFCSIVTLYKRTWRGYSVKRIMEDITELGSKYGIKDFYFNDDLINADHKRFVEFIDALVKSNGDYNWGTSGIRADGVLRLDESLIENMLKSGCKNLDVGVETGSPRLLKVVKKDTTLEVIRAANKKISKYPIIMKYTFMAGYPTETDKEFSETLRFRRTLMEENEYATAPIFCYTPFPGTEMYQLAIENGFKPPTTLSEWADFDYNTWHRKHPCWLTNKKVRLVENAVFLSYFSNKKLAYKYPNPLLSALFKMYYPLAKLRYENDYYGLMIEKYAADFLIKINEKFDLFNRFQKNLAKAPV